MDQSLAINQYLTINFDSQPVRFTLDGKVSVIDVIKVLCDPDHPFTLWEKIKSDHPEILPYCDHYLFQKGEAIPVIDGKGWEKLWMLLPLYMAWC
jgi:hypothetical protein